MIGQFIKSSIVILVFIAFLFCCEKGYEDHTGFNTTLKPSMKGFTYLHADERAGTIHFSGTGKISDGMLYIKLLKPDGSIVFQQDFSGSDVLDFHYSFPPKNGEWQLTYECLKGTGEIDLELYN